MTHKKLLIRTYGCQMNVYDSGRMAELLAPIGYGPTDVPAEADMVILNTCHIREKAAEKVYSELGRLRPLKAGREAAGGRMIVAVAGCVAQAEGEEIRARAPVVDIVVGPQSYHRLPELVARVARAGGTELATDFPAIGKFDHLDGAGRDHHGPTAFLTVQEGCDKFCTFCVVPYTRGAEYSRPASAVLAEARDLVRCGAAEITLLGQNVNAYHGEGPDGRAWSLARLIKALAEIAGLERIRYTTSHPLDMDEDLIAAHGAVPQLMPYLHLPVQSGSDRVLAAMNRRHTVADYLAVVDRLRTARPDLALSSDFIVGFPGETEAEAAATVDLARQVGFTMAFSFKYSARPGTPGSALPGQVPEADKEARLTRLNAALDEARGAFDRATVGRTVPVLFERPGKHPGQLIGRSPHLQAVHATAPATLIGRVAPVRVEAALSNSLAGSLVETGLAA